MKLFSLSSSKELAQSVAQKLSLSLSDYNLVTFGDSEIKPVIKQEVRGETCVIIGSTSNPVNDTYMELFLTVDALKRSAAEKVIVAMPYMGYARQNQQHMPGEPVSAHVMVKFIESAGIDEMITLDLHEEQLTGFFDIPLAHLSALPLLAKVVGTFIAESEDSSAEIVVVSPDQGGVERTRKFRDSLDDQGGDTLSVSSNTVIVEKLRNLEGQHDTKVVEVSGEVTDMIAIIPDDVIVSGGTIAHAADAVKKAGAKRIYLCATHADFIDKTKEQLDSDIVEQVIVTDSIAIRDEWQFSRLHTVSVADLLAEEIGRH